MFDIVDLIAIIFLSGMALWYVLACDELKEHRK